LRFLVHVLPKGLHRIRHYGLLARSACAGNIARVRELLAVVKPKGEPIGAVVDPCKSLFGVDWTCAVDIQSGADAPQRTLRTRWTRTQSRPVDLPPHHRWIGAHDMAMAQVEDRLAAILAADVAGYLRLMGTD
jgi:hypothetical protein